MTREEILAMSAGRKLDALVAKYVMFPRHSHPIEEVQGWCQCYSTLISAAWKVLEKPEIMDRIQIGVYPTSFGKWIARPYMAGYKDSTVMADTAPLAICRCALLAVIERTDEE